MRGRKKKFVLALAVLFVAVVVAVVLWPGEREPQYQGRKLSEWIGKARFELDPQSAKRGTGPFTLVVDLKGRSRDEVTAAVRCMGTNATQLLVQWVEYAPPKWRGKIVRYLNWLPNSIVRKAIIWSVSYKGTCRAMAAANALAFMKPDEVPMEELRRIAGDTNYRSKAMVTSIINLIDENGTEGNDQSTGRDGK